MRKKGKITIRENGTLRREVGSLAHSLGCRFRLDDRELPGRPHLVFKSHNLVVFTVDCFWYPHSGCGQRQPLSRLREYQLNAEELALVQQAFHHRGVRCEVIWECQGKDPVALLRRLALMLEQAVPVRAAGQLPEKP